MVDIVQRPAPLETSPAELRDGRDLGLDFIKGILILLVVFGHSIQWIVHAGTEDYWDDGLFRAIYLFHMPAFIAVSGYLAARRIDAATRLGQFFFRRTLPLLLAMAVWAAWPNLARAYVGLETHIRSDVWKDFRGSFWFLWAVVISSAGAFAATRFGAYERAALLLIAAALLLAPLPDFPPSAIRYTAAFYLIAFLAGRAGVTIRAIPPHVAVTAGAAAAVGWLFWTRDTYIYNNGFAYWRPGVAGHLALMLPVSIAATLAFLRAAVALHDRIAPSAAARTVIAVGGITLEIYLAQTVAFRATSLLPEFAAGYLDAAAATAVIVAGTAALVALSRRLPGGELLWGRPPALPFRARND
ncbi:nodulation protein NolL [Methylosinus sp. C49]|uniref:acyltransferase family protein n=1 Tax=Methylosinus sp. C49 TaxID=2699395 RepID=UPI0013676C74|nr:acyltransferase family protein [Methylosinus sp. C49]BBU62416.1 nodulation protein NolL [Methylosinus sp. C49]